MKKALGIQCAVLLCIGVVRNVGKSEQSETMRATFENDASLTLYAANYGSPPIPDVAYVKSN